MDDDLTVRRFVRGDAEALTDLLHSAYSPLLSQGLNFTAATQDVATTLDRVSRGATWIVEHEGRLAATMTLVLPPNEDVQSLSKEARVPKRAWVEQVAVDSKLRGRHVSRQLFDVAAGWAGANAITSLGLDTALPAEHLLKMYTNWGFELTGIIHFGSKNYDSVVMVKSLARQ